MYRNYDETIEHRSASCSDIKKVGPKKNLPTNGRMHGLVSFSFGRAGILSSLPALLYPSRVQSTKSISLQ